MIISMLVRKVGALMRAHMMMEIEKNSMFLWQADTLPEVWMPTEYSKMKQNPFCV